MLRRWKVIERGRSRETKTGITSAIAFNLEAISESTSMSPRQREQKSKPFRIALEGIFLRASSAIESAKKTKEM